LGPVVTGLLVCGPALAEAAAKPDVRSTARTNRMMSPPDLTPMKQDGCHRVSVQIAAGDSRSERAVPYGNRTRAAS
jgi:hypothetical protein